MPDVASVLDVSRARLQGTFPAAVGNLTNLMCVCSRACRARDASRVPICVCVCVHVLQLPRRVLERLVVDATVGPHQSHSTAVPWRGRHRHSSSPACCDHTAHVANGLGSVIKWAHWLLAKQCRRHGGVEVRRVCSEWSFLPFLSSFCLSFSPPHTPVVLSLPVSLRFRGLFFFRCAHACMRRSSVTNTCLRHDRNLCARAQTPVTGRQLLQWHNPCDVVETGQPVVSGAGGVSPLL